MRVYLVIMDDSEEVHGALRFATRRASKTGGAVHILAVVPHQPFSAFAGIQATIEEEARARAEVIATAAAGSMVSEVGLMPKITVETGDAVEVARWYLESHPEVHALVLSAAPQGTPNPLVAHFTSTGLGSLPCPLMIVPASLSNDEIDRLS